MTLIQNVYTDRWTENKNNVVIKINEISIVQFR